MGYYSQEFFSTTKGGYNRLMELVELESRRAGDKYPIKSFSTFIELPNGVIFGEEEVRWYGNEVYSFERAFKKFDAEGNPWTRIHIGEETGDVEENYSKNAWDLDIPRLRTETDWSYE